MSFAVLGTSFSNVSGFAFLTGAYVCSASEILVVPLMNVLHAMLNCFMSSPDATHTVPQVSTQAFPALWRHFVGR